MIEIQNSGIHKTDRHKVKSVVILKLCDSQLLQVQSDNHFYSVCSMGTNICLDLYDPKRSCPYGVCDVYRVQGVRGLCSILHPHNGSHRLRQMFVPILHAKYKRLSVCT